MLTKTEGIVIRSVKYSESSNIVDIYTEALGLKTYIFNGVRSLKPKISPALVQPMAIVDLVVYDGIDKKINRTKEIKSAFQFEYLPYDMIKSSIGLFIVEIISKTNSVGYINENLYGFYKKALVQLDKEKSDLVYFPIIFLIQLSHHLGIMPMPFNGNSECFFDLKTAEFTEEPPVHSYFLNEKLSAFLNQILHDENNVKTLLDYYERKQMIDELLKFYNFQLDKEITLKSVTILNQIFS